MEKTIKSQKNDIHRVQKRSILEYQTSLICNISNKINKKLLQLQRKFERLGDKNNTILCDYLRIFFINAILL